MKKFRTTRRVAHSADDMFALVADVERYPEFLPLCKALNMRGGEEVSGKTVLMSDMTVAYKFINESFATRVTLDPEAREILVEYLDGPFRHLENTWSFRPAGESACDVEFYIAYELKSPPLQMLMGGMFDHAFRRFAQAFEERADIIYGKSDHTPQQA